VCCFGRVLVPIALHGSVRAQLQLGELNQRLPPLMGEIEHQALLLAACSALHDDARMMTLATVARPRTFVAAPGQNGADVSPAIDSIVRFVNSQSSLPDRVHNHPPAPVPA